MTMASNRLISSLQLFWGTICLGSVMVASNSVGAESVLTIGSKAPELDIEHWIASDDDKKSPVKKFDEGKVYVVEFWATWCGPCLASMPHLAELQKQYRDQGVRIISVSDEELSTVTRFLQREVPAGMLPSDEGKERVNEDSAISFAELTSAYSLTTDPDRSVHTEYMEAAGEDGIPTAFIVGKKGEVEWIGHPMEIDEPLKKIVADQWDRKQFIEERAAQKEIEKSIMEVYELLQAGKLDQGLMQLDKLIKSGSNKELTAGLRMMQLELLIQIDPLRAVGVLKDALETLDDPQVLNAMAWSVVELTQDDEGQELEPELLKLAIETAEKSVRLAPKDGLVLDTLSHLVHMNGELDRAIQLQTKAVELAPEIDQVKEFLEELKQEKAAAGS
jgi:thiol-disulfide isomerase/thioredoxin